MDGLFHICSLDIQLDSSVHSMTKVAAMGLSGEIQKGIYLTENPNPRIKIYKNRIEFGKCYDTDLQNVTGSIFPNYFVEFGNLIYYFDKIYKCSFWEKRIDYVGLFPPSVPENEMIFNMIYPKFA